MNALVSIIVPIYKVEIFLEKCIQSLINQTYPKTEIILVDDGSPDLCGKILDQYKQQYPELIVIHKQNGGVSAARNDGLAAASGEYIMFVDGDDYVEPDYVSYFVSLIERENSDMAVSTRVYTKDGQPQDSEQYSVADSAQIVESIYMNRIGVAVWNKIYRKKTLDDCGIIFNTEYWFAEGMLYNITYLQHVRRVAIGNRRVYHFADNDNSATRLFNLNSYLCGLRSMEYQRDHWLYANNSIKMAWEYHYRRYAELILRGILQSNTVERYPDIFAACQHALRKNLHIPLQVDMAIWAKTEAVCLAIDPLLTLNAQRFSNLGNLRKKLNLFLIKLVNKTSERIRQRVFAALEKHYRKHYRPVYLEKKLL